jgi:hypothetical protein
MHTDDESGVEQDFSDNENVTWEQARNFKLLFGKFKGLELQDMIKTKDRRSTLRFYMGWDKLRDDARENIRVALKHYAKLKSNN